MSIFGSIMRDFDHDPFFSNQLETMRRMENMMDNMMNPFGMMGMGFPRLAPEPRRPDPFTTDALMPFGFGRSLFPNIGNIFNNMSQMVPAPSMHSYSSSSVMTYTTDENGQPQVYQATSSTRLAPGGVKETRNSMQDSRSGLQKMAIGHHLGERAHIVEKEQNRFTGELNENQEFINLEEEEAPSFNEEWREKARPFNQRRRNGNAANQIESRLRVEEVPAIMDHAHSGGDDNTPEPIITEPDEPAASSSRASSGISSVSSSSSRKRESPDLGGSDANHLHKPNRSEMKHKRRHHAYPSGHGHHVSKSGHRADKSKAPKTRHESNI